MAHNSIVRLHAVVSGRVQGVGFRAFVQAKAIGLGLTGWVRNNFSGDVEVLAEGPQVSLNQLLELLNQGPRAAYISQVQQSWDAATGEFRYFSIQDNRFD